MGQLEQFFGRFWSYFYSTFDQFLPHISPNIAKLCKKFENFDCLLISTGIYSKVPWSIYNIKNGVFGSLEYFFTQIYSNFNPIFDQFLPTCRQIWQNLANNSKILMFQFYRPVYFRRFEDQYNT